MQGYAFSSSLNLVNHQIDDTITTKEEKYTNNNQRSSDTCEALLEKKTERISIIKKRR
jgi:hypothetical protein